MNRPPGHDGCSGSGSGYDSARSSISETSFHTQNSPVVPAVGAESRNESSPRPGEDSRAAPHNLTERFEGLALDSSQGADTAEADRRASSSDEDSEDWESTSTTSDENGDTQLDATELKHGCEHYRRQCKIVAPCWCVCCLLRLPILGKLDGYSGGCVGGLPKLCLTQQQSVLVSPLPQRRRERGRQPVSREPGFKALNRRGVASLRSGPLASCTATLRLAKWIGRRLGRSSVRFVKGGSPSQTVAKVAVHSLGRTFAASANSGTTKARPRGWAVCTPWFRCSAYRRPLGSCPWPFPLMPGGLRGCPSKLPSRFSSSRQVAARVAPLLSWGVGFHCDSKSCFQVYASTGLSL